MTGNRKPWPRAALRLLQTQQAGFTYLWLMLTVAMASAGSAVLGEMWQTQSLRSKEQEQIFRLQSFEAALNSYAAATPTGRPCQPTDLEELLEDHRSGKVKRHLRTLYLDPFSKQLDWVVERSPSGGIKSIKSSKHAIELITAQDGRPSPSGLTPGGAGLLPKTLARSKDCPAR